MRSTQRVSVWPVGLVGGMKFESPVVEGGKVGARAEVQIRFSPFQLFLTPCTKKNVSQGGPLPHRLASQPALPHGHGGLRRFPPTGPGQSGRLFRRRGSDGLSGKQLPEGTGYHGRTGAQSGQLLQSARFFPHSRARVGRFQRCRAFFKLPRVFALCRCWCGTRARRSPR